MHSKVSLCDLASAAILTSLVIQATQLNLLIVVGDAVVDLVFDDGDVGSVVVVAAIIAIVVTAAIVVMAVTVVIVGVAGAGAGLTGLAIVDAGADDASAGAAILVMLVAVIFG